MKAALAAIAVALVAGSADPIVVTRDSLALPTGCSPREVAQTIVRFFDAYNRRDLAALDRMFAPPRTESSSYIFSRSFKRRPTFRWYTTADARVHDRERLRAHFASRKDELRLRFVDMNTSWVLRSVGFTFRALRDGRRVIGKGELHCPSRRFYVWSEGFDDFDWDTGGPIVAESRSGRRPNAQEVAPDYRLETTKATMPGRCRPALAERRILTMLRAFNVGDGKAFAVGLAPKAVFHPYWAFGERAYDRSQVPGFVERRHEAGDGWTATALKPPLITRPRRLAVYSLSLGKLGGAKIPIDCRSGLVLRWVGPAVRSPG